MSTQASEVKPSVPARLRRRRGVAMVAMSLVLVVGGTIGVLTEDQGFVWVERLLNHPFLFGCAAALLFGLGVALLTRHRWLGVSAQVIGVTVALAWAALGVVASSWFGTSPVARATAPGGDYQVVVEEGTDVIDPMWEIVVEQRGGLLARRWEVGCISGDWNGFRGVAWPNSRVLVVSTANGRALVHIDSQTGRPTLDTDHLWGC